MGFYSQRYLAALQSHRRWAPLIVVPLVVYLIGAAVLEQRYVLTQEFSYSGTVLVSKNPVSTIGLDVLVADPDQLFLDGFAIAQLQRNLELRQDVGVSVQDVADVRRLVHGALTLVGEGDAKLQLSYTGDDADLGRHLLGFYTDRLMQRIANAQGPLSDPAPRFEQAGPISSSTQMVLWSADRLPAAIAIFGVSLLAFLLLVGMRELANPAFASERQIARYLGLPVLGSLPNAERLVSHLSK